MTRTIKIAAPRLLRFGRDGGSCMGRDPQWHLQRKLAGSRMKRVVLLAVAGAMVCVPSALAGGKADTRVTLDNIQSFPSGGVHTIWSGDIFSSQKSCKNERKVIVYRVLDGADEKRGSTLSYKGSAQPGYYWLYEEDGIPPAGDYYAKVRPTDGCKGDRSSTFGFGR